MRALTVEQPGGPDAFHEVELPAPEPGAGEVRIRIAAVSVNPVDCKMRSGALRVPLPAVLGRDVAGVVDALGDGAEHFSPGEPVMAVLFGPRSNGAYAEQVCVPEAFVARAPAGLAPAEAASLGVAGLTAARVAAAAPLGPADTALVTGASGGVGSFLVPLLAHHGVGNVIATAGGDASAAYLVDALGIDPARIVRHPGRDGETLATDVRAAAGPGGVTRAFDLVGGAMKRLCFATLGFEGRVVSIVEEPEEFALPIWQPGGPMFERSASYHFVATSARARNGGPEDWAVYREWLDAWTGLVASGALRLPPITVVGPLDAAHLAEAHRRLEAGGHQGKLALTVD